MGRLNTFSKPELLTVEHKLDTFDCGHQTLNEWLIKCALKNQKNGASRTFVSTYNNEVVAYYSLASGSIERLLAPKKLSRNMPNPIPVVILARLAVDKNHQGQNLGGRLLRNALLRTLAVAQNIGIKAVLVHAISESAKIFYQQYGFKESANNPMLLFYSVRDIVINFKRNF